MLTFRKYILFILTICCASILFAYFLQYFFKLEVCSLCMVQRLAIYAISIVCVISLVYHKTNIIKYFYNNLIFFFSGFGLAVAGRQVWLQSLPPEQIPSCLADMDRLLSMYSYLEVFKKIIMTSGDCAKIEMKILWFTLPQLTALLFLFIVLCAIYSNILIFKKKL